MFIMVARKRHCHEGSELDWTAEDVVPETHMHILKGSMIVAVVDRKLMRKGAVILAESVRHAQVDRELICDSVVEFLNDAK